MRHQWIAGELAAGRVPDLRIVEPEPVPFDSLRVVADRWVASRIDVADATRGVHRKALVHVLEAFGDRDPADLDAREIGAWIGELAGRYSRGTCEKLLGALRMVLDFADIQPNPARDDRVKLPRTNRREVMPPSSREAAVLTRAASPRYRLTLVVIEATGMRVGELETLRWGDVDEPAGRWRVAREHEKAGRGRWVNVPPDVFAAVVALVPREDRDSTGRVFGHVTQAKLRTDMSRACKAAGIPLYSPHDLRHRRISLGTCKACRSRRSASGSGNGT